MIASIFKPEHEAVLESVKIPVVILGQQHPGYSCVYHDDFGAARAATARMLEKGRRLPGFLGATMLDKAVGQARRAGYEAALRDAGLMPRAQRISVAKFNMESGYEQARQLFEGEGYTPGTADELLDQLADPHARPRELELGWELKCRASTGDENADENIWAL